MRGFKLLEKSIGGFNSGKLIVIGGRPYMNKELFLNDIIKNIIADELQTLYFFNQFNENSVAQNSRIKMFSSSEDIDSLLDIIRTEVTKNNLSIVFIDSIERISYSSGWITGNVRKKVAKKLQILTKELQIPIVALTELSEKVETRQPNNPKPILNDLSCVQDFADKVILINRPEYYGITEDAEGYKTHGSYFMNVFNNTESDTIRFNLNENTNEFIELGIAKYY